MSADDFKAQGNKAFLAKDYPTAIDFFSKAIDLDPTNHVLYSNRSACYASQKNYEQALEDGEKTVELKADWGKGYGRKAAALFGLGRYPEANDVYEAGLKVEPTNVQLQKGLQETQQAMEKEASMGIGQFFGPDVLTKMAANPKLAPLLAQPDLVEKVRAIQANPNALNQHMQDPRIMSLLMGLMGLDARGPEDGPGPMDYEPTSPPTASTQSPPASQPAQPTSKKEEPKPKPEEPKEEEMPSEEELKKKEAAKVKDLGNASYKARKFDEALEHYGKAWELDPTNISILTNKAAVYFEMGSYEECIKTCEEAIDVGREHRADYKLIAKALGRIGTAYFKQNNLTEAIRYYGKSLAEHRTPDILTKLKEAEKAKAKADKDAYRDPALSAEARERGNALFKHSDFAGAVKEYTEAIKRDDTDPRAYSNRAACYTKLMAINEALKDCETCISLDPKFVKGYIRKAAIQFLKKEYTECLETCQQAKEADVDKKNAAEIDQQISKVYMEMSRGPQRREGETEAETLARAQQDPEVQKIMGDPAMRSILQQMQEDPQAAQEHMKNPMVAANIRKLVNAGIIRLG
ncbi:chaperone activator Sti1 [Gamsiella multidivaricata]|uniref:chaperone activator Sti1 n=1 Tax=Gamsiella multidivaricata TaxID=101098 RepID=UPI0022200E54|nr:chaperone activator Sti1 [Gamsiella multidivaricata]KAG0367244.1 Hsp90 cochaperone [Gamsiella multidivaricata]KAI7827508.1 chaperone activator Sti1 [Gamsiella multidivaricata]